MHRPAHHPSVDGLCHWANPPRPRLGGCWAGLLRKAKHFDLHCRTRDSVRRGTLWLRLSPSLTLAIRCYRLKPKHEHLNCHVILWHA